MAADINTAIAVHLGYHFENHPVTPPRRSN